MPSHRPPNSPAEADRGRAVADSKTELKDSRQLILDTNAAGAASVPPLEHPPVILRHGPDCSVLVYERTENGEPVYRVVKERIKAASTAAVLARKLKDGKR